MSTEKFKNGLRKTLSNQAEAFGLKGSQALDIIALTKNAIKEELQAEINRGHSKTVKDFLQNNAIRYGKDLLFDKIIQRVASRLILRLGLPGGLAVTIASYLVPMLLKSISKKILKHNKVQGFLAGITIPASIEFIQEAKNKVTNTLKKPITE